MQKFTWLTIRICCAHVDLTNVFDQFLPQLLTYPNPMDPLNSDAAALYLHEPEKFKKKVSDYVTKYATEAALRELDGQKAESDDEASSLSDASDEDDVVKDMDL